MSTDQDTRPGLADAVLAQLGAAVPAATAHRASLLPGAR